jgi:hypothetical protein
MTYLDPEASRLVHLSIHFDLTKDHNGTDTRLGEAIEAFGPTRV